MIAVALSATRRWRTRRGRGRTHSRTRPDYRETEPGAVRAGLLVHEGLVLFLLMRSSESEGEGEGHPSNLLATALGLEVDGARLQEVFETDETHQALIRAPFDDGEFRQAGLGHAVDDEPQGLVGVSDGRGGPDGRLEPNRRIS